MLQFPENMADARLKKKSRWLLPACALLLCGYLAWSRLSALLFLRWLARETGAPVQVLSAKWSIDPRQLLRGRIEELDFSVLHRPTNAVARIKGPVELERSSGSWAMRLQPEIQIQGLPPLRGTARVIFNSFWFRSFSLDLDLSCAEAARAQGWAAALEARKCSVLAQMRSDDRTRKGTLVTQLEEARLKTRDFHLTSRQVYFSADLQPKKTSLFPLVITLKAQFKDLALLGTAYPISEPRIDVSAHAVVSPERIEINDLSLVHPIEIRVHGAALSESRAGDLFYSLKAKLGMLVDQRIAPWFGVEHRQVREASAEGVLSISGRWTGKFEEGFPFIAKGSVLLDAKRLSLPKMGLKASNLVLRLPYEFPSLDDSARSWGRIAARTLEFKSVLLKKPRVFTRLSEDGLEFTTENAAGEDEPIRQYAWGGPIDVSNLYVFKPWNGVPELTASIEGGPFELTAIQKDLCIASKNPVPGQFSFFYPELLQAEDVLVFHGKTELNLFGGTAEIGDLRWTGGPKAGPPRLSASAAWNDLDLALLGKWTKMGDMRGGLNGHLKNAVFSLTDLGVFPLSYDLRIEGSYRGAEAIRFYGRAIDSIMRLFGIERETMPWYADLGIRASVLWRNLLPATASYMGFEAKTVGGWTALSTFDPPGSKKHYMLYGREFKIPLNTHGVYPLLMRTEAFQRWLWERVEYFKRRMKSADTKADGPECVPIW